VSDEDDGREEVLRQEPDSSLWERFMLELLAPLTPESLL
jgi:putative cardiolipin synthase